MEQNQKSDYACYSGDLAKFESHYPRCRLTRFIGHIVNELIAGEVAMIGVHAALPEMIRTIDSRVRRIPETPVRRSA